MSIEEEKYVEAESQLIAAISGFYVAGQDIGLDIDQIAEDIESAVHRGTEGAINFSNF